MIGEGYIPAVLSYLIGEHHEHTSGTRDILE